LKKITTLIYSVQATTPDCQLRLHRQLDLVCTCKHVTLALKSTQTSKCGRSFCQNKTTPQMIKTQDEQQVVSEMWTRPVLCRLCECPVSDGGVRVDQLDAAKLSEWWLRKIGTDFLPEESEVKEIICNFCIWDARYYFISSRSNFVH